MAPFRLICRYTVSPIRGATGTCGPGKSPGGEVSGICQVN